MDKEIYSDGYVLEFSSTERALYRNPIQPSLTAEDTRYTIKQGDTLEHISYKFYRDSKLWYIIADNNNIINPFEMIIGNVLIIPKLKQS